MSDEGKEKIEDFSHRERGEEGREKGGGAKGYKSIKLSLSLSLYPKFPILQQIGQLFQRTITSFLGF